MSNKIQLNKSLRQNFFLANENLSAEKVKEAGVLSWWNSNKKIHLSCQAFKRYLSALPSSVYSERLFSEAGNLYENKQNRLLPKTSEKLLYLYHSLKKQE